MSCKMDSVTAGSDSALAAAAVLLFLLSLS